MQATHINLRGQWIGQTTGANHAFVVVNFDEMQNIYKGVAYFLESNPSLASIAGFFSTPDKSPGFSCRAQLSPIDPSTGIILNPEQIKLRCPDVKISEFADMTGSCDHETLLISWETPVGTAGTFKLKRPKMAEKSEIEPYACDWEGFKSHIGRFASGKWFYRGQAGPWRLRTPFHRTGRADLNRYLHEDIPLSYRHLSAGIKHLYDPAKPGRNVSIFHLLQQHGYPTPLLDWTFSPYVAAFFAYAGMSKELAERAAPKDKIRIFIFDQVNWRLDCSQFYHVIPGALHFSIGESVGVESDRSIPQQAVSTLTNVDDIESYIAAFEKHKKYLFAVDLPVSERRKVIQELGLMGITAGSLFPGLDGAREKFKERNFNQSES
jgi:hypothetical protein